MLIKCYCHHFVHYFLANKVVERYYIRISKQISVYKKIPLASLLAVAAVCPIVPYYEIFSSSPLQSPFGLLPLNSKRYSNISLSNYMYSVIFFSIQTLHTRICLTLALSFVSSVEIYGQHQKRSKKIWIRSRPSEKYK